MPIRLNLLAEDQAAEELRRRDPVKRALWLAAVLVSGMLLWAGWLQFRTFMAGSALGKVEKEIALHTAEFQDVLDIQKKASDVDLKLNALRELAMHRYLNGTMLDALQQTTVENVQMLRLKVDQNYLFTEGAKAKTLESGKVLPAKPPTWTEKIVLTLEAKDSAANPGDEVNPFKEKIANHPYFQAMLGKTNEVRLTALSPPQTMQDSRPFVQFTLECRYPEKTR